MRVDAPQSICGNPPEPIPEQLDTTHAALPWTHHDEAAKLTRTEAEKPGDQRRPRKGNPTRNFLRSCCPASHSYEPVTRTKTADQGTKEAASHAIGQQ